MTKINRLLSNLPFNPSLINQVSFYSKRLKQETSVRRLGFAFMALTFMVQLFAVIAPPQPSLAQDINNDIIPGGFQNRDQAVLHCIDPNKDFSTILAHFNISCDNVAAATTELIQSTNDNRKIRSMGRLPYGIGNETAEVIGGSTYYMRYLWAWDQGTPSTYKVLQGLSNSGQTFYILFNCGNLSIIDAPQPPPPPPTPTPEPFADCSIMLINYDSGSKVKKGTEIVVRGQVTGGNLPAGTTADLTYEYINKTTGAPAGPSITAQGVGFVDGVALDPFNRSFTVKNDGAYEFRLAATYAGGKEVRGSRTGKCASTIYVNTPDVCPEIPGDQTEESQCKPCEKAKDKDGIACLVMFKKGSNITTNVADANGTTAKAGDVITYTLSTKNTGKATVKKFVVIENISDILDYADVTDYHGGVIDDKNIVRWPAADIKAGATLEQKLTVKIKDPIPQTPVSTSNPGKFDLTMTNVYGTTVNIKLPPSVVKTTEQITTTLPNTGPGTNIVIGVVLTVVVGYFFARSRLLAKELDIVRVEYATGA